MFLLLVVWSMNRIIYYLGVRSKVVADVAVTPVLGKSGVPPIPPNPP